MLNVGYTSILKRHRLEVSERIRKIPKEMFPRVGYGLLVPKEFEEEFQAVVRTRNMILSGSTTTDVPTHIKDISMVGKIFNRAQAACFADWFLQSFRLGHPSHLLARAVVEELSALQASLARRDQSASRKSLAFMSQEAVVEMFDNYIGLAKNVVPAEEKGWAYLAWRSEANLCLFPGAAEGAMYEILDGLATRNAWREHGFGLVGAWLVHDPEFAAATIREIFAEFPSKRGGYLLNLGSMSDAIENALVASDNLVLSPWHVDDEHAIERLGLLQRRQDSVLQAEQDDLPVMAAF